MIGKKVDYGFCFNPNNEEVEKIRNVRRQMLENYSSISQSTAQKLVGRSLFANLGIKRRHAGRDPLPQIAVWSSAGLTKLAYLAGLAGERNFTTTVPLDPTVPSLPCWTVEGHQWQFFVAKKCSKSLVVSLTSTVL